MEETMTHDEVRTFGEKLRTFGDQLTPKEQLLLSEILARAAAESDVEGHAMRVPHPSKPSWPETRQHIFSLLKQIREDYNRGASQTRLTAPYIHHES